MAQAMQSSALSRPCANYQQLLVLSGDVPLLKSETIARLRDFHIEQRAAMTILTAAPADPSGYGRVLRKSGGLARSNGDR